MQYSSEQTKDIQKKAKLTCIGSILLHFILGSVYSYGNINVYLVSYFKHVDIKNSYLNVDIAAFLFPLSTLLIFITNPIGIKIGNAIGFSLSCLFFSVLLSLSIFLSSFCENFWLFALFFTILPGLSMGLLSSQSMYVLYKYYPNRNWVNGLMMISYGIGTCIVNVFSLYMINSDNNILIPLMNHDDLYLPPSLLTNVPNFIRGLAIIYFLFGLMGSSMIKSPEFDTLIEDNQNPQSLISKEDYSENIYVHFEVERDDSKKYYLGLQDDVDHVDYYSLKSAMKAFKFYHFLFLIILSSSYGFFITNYFKIIGIRSINNDAFYCLIGCINGLVNGLSRFVMPLIVEKIRFKILFIILIIIQIGLIPSLISILNNDVLYGVWNAFLMICHGGFSSIFPKAIYKEYGKNLWIKIYSFMLFGFVFSNLLQFTISISLFDVLGLYVILWVFFAMSLIALILILTFKERN